MRKSEIEIGGVFVIGPVCQAVAHLLVSLGAFHELEPFYVGEGTVALSRLWEAGDFPFIEGFQAIHLSGRVEVAGNGCVVVKAPFEAGALQIVDAAVYFDIISRSGNDFGRVVAPYLPGPGSILQESVYRVVCLDCNVNRVVLGDDEGVGTYRVVKWQGVCVEAKRVSCIQSLKTTRHGECVDRSAGNDQQQK